MSRQEPSRPLVDEVFAGIRMYQNANDALDEAALVFFGVNRTDGRCLDMLGFRGPMTAGELAAVTGLTTGSVTSLIDRLEAQDLVRRRPDDSDRRRVIVELTDEAERIAEEVYGPVGAEGRPLVEAYSDEELAVISRFLGQARELAEAHAVRVRAMAPRARRRLRSGH
jgi:DNA-binding MarR family transcriptional regulator